MANILDNLMLKIIARSFMNLRKRLNFVSRVNQSYSNEAKKKGSTVDIPKSSVVVLEDVVPGPNNPTTPDTEVEMVQITLNNWKKGSFYLTDDDMGKIDAQANFLPMQTNEAIAAMANGMNLTVHQTYKGIYGFVGTPGVHPFASVDTATDAGLVLSTQDCPAEGRSAVIDFVAQSKAQALPAFSDAEKIGDSSVKLTGEIGQKFGINWVADSQVQNHIAGTFTGITVNGANAAGVTEMVMAAQATTGSLAAVVGDIFTIAGQTQTYVVTAAATAAAGATATVSFAPALVEATLGGEVVTVKGDHKVNLAFHRDAFGFANRNLLEVTRLQNLPSAQMKMTVTDPDTQLTMELRVREEYHRWVWEFSALWGARLVEPKLACRIAGAVN